MARTRIALALPILLGCLARSEAAVQPLSVAEKSTIDFAFATQLGSGIYSIEGRTVQIYRIPLSYTVRPESADRFGMRVTFPLTFGFFDFETRDVLETGLPESMDTVSLVPGLELRFQVQPRWLLRPYLELGAARDRSRDGSAYVGSLGLRSLADFESGGWGVALGNSLSYARVAPTGDVEVDDFVALDTSVEARHGMGLDLRGHEPDFGLYASADLYFDDPDFPLASDSAPNVHDQYELGVTFGTREPMRWMKIPLPRLGFGYRFGSDASAFRFVIGSVAPALKR